MRSDILEPDEMPPYRQAVDDVLAALETDVQEGLNRAVKGF